MADPFQPHLDCRPRRHRHATRAALIGSLAGRSKLRGMARYFDVHPVDPQRRVIGQVVEILRAGGLIAYPTDSCFALGCHLGDRQGIERIREIRQLDPKHQFTLVCRDFAQLGKFVHVSNAVFRVDQGGDPGPVHVHPAGHQGGAAPAVAPEAQDGRGAHPEHVVTQAILTELGEPLLSSTLLLPDQDEPMTQGWEIKERLDHAVDAVIDSGDCGTEPTTVIDFSQPEPEIVRRGAGDPTPFE